MPRTRYIKSDFFTDGDISDLAPDFQLLFIGLWCYADRDGRLEDRPREIKARLFPYREVDVEAGLSALAIKPFLLRYEVEGKKYLQIMNFAKHQRPHVTELPSKIPPPTSLDKNNASLTQVKRKDLRIYGDGDGDGDYNGDGDGESPRSVTPDAASEKYFPENAKKLTARFVELLRGNDTKVKIPANLNAWNRAADLLLRKDGRAESEATAVLEWCQRDNFWCCNILSMTKFRIKYTTLLLQMQRRGVLINQPSAVPGKYEC